MFIILLVMIWRQIIENYNSVSAQRWNSDWKKYSDLFEKDTDCFLENNVIYIYWTQWENINDMYDVTLIFSNMLCWFETTSKQFYKPLIYNTSITRTFDYKRIDE